MCGGEDGGMYLDISSIDAQRIPLGIQEPHISKPPQHREMTPTPLATGS